VLVSYLSSHDRMARQDQGGKQSADRRADDTEIRSFGEEDAASKGFYTESRAFLRKKRAKEKSKKQERRRWLRESSISYLAQKIWRTVQKKASPVSIDGKGDTSRKEGVREVLKEGMVLILWREGNKGDQRPVSHQLAKVPGKGN